MSIDPVLMEFQANYEEALAGIQSLKDALISLGEVMTEAVGAYQEASAAINEYTSSLAEAGAAAEEATPAIQENTDALAANGAAATDAGAGGLADFAGGAKKLIGPLTIATAAVVGIGVGAVAMQAHYESAMSVVQALTGQSAQTMASLNSQVLAMAQALGAQPEALANGLYFILSAGVKAKDAMGVLQVVTEASAAGFVDAQTDADALTTALNSYGQGANQAMNYQDMLLVAVRDGKTTLDQLAGSLGRAAVTGNAAGVGFGDVAAALSTMTLDGDSARMASMQLSGLLRAVGINIDSVAKAAKGFHLSFDKAKFSTMDLHDKLVYLWTITKGNKEELLKLTGGAQGFLAANILMSKGGQTFANIMTDMRNSSGMTAKAFQVHEQTMGAVWDHFKASMSVALISIGHALEPFVKQLLNGLMPQLARFGQWVSTHGQQAAAIFGTIAAVLVGSLIGALAAVAIGFIAANIEIIAVVAAVGVLVGGIVFLVTHWQEIINKAGPLHDIFGKLQPVIQFLGNYFHLLAQVWQTQILPALAQLLPLLKVLAIVLGVMLVVGIAVAIGPILLLVGVITGVIFVLIKLVQFLGSLPGIVGAALGAVGNFFGSIFGAIGSFIGQQVQLWRERFQAGVAALQALVSAGFHKLLDIITAPIRGVVALFGWLFNHNYFFHDLVVSIQQDFTAAKAFLLNLWTSVTHWLADQWNRIKADAMMAWLLVQAYVIHPVQQAITEVQQKLNQARQFILGVWGQVKADAESAWERFLSLISTTVARVKTEASKIATAILTPIQNLGATLLDAGKHLVEMLIQGITSMAGKVGDAAKNIAGKITSFLGFHSPTEEGPGATADQWMPSLMTMLASGLDANTGKLQSAAQRAAGALAGAFQGGITPGAITPAIAPNLGAGGLGAGGGANTAVLALLQQIATGVNRAPGLGSQPTPASLGSVVQNLGGVTMNGISDIGTFYQRLNALAGLAIENGNRGATAGLGI